MIIRYWDPLGKEALRDPIGVTGMVRGISMGRLGTLGVMRDGEGIEGESL